MRIKELPPIVCEEKLELIRNIRITYRALQDSLCSKAQNFSRASELYNGYAKMTTNKHMLLSNADISSMSDVLYDWNKPDWLDDKNYKYVAALDLYLFTENKYNSIIRIDYEGNCKFDYKVNKAIKEGESFIARLHEAESLIEYLLFIKRQNIPLYLQAHDIELLSKIASLNKDSDPYALYGGIDLFEDVDKASSMLVRMIVRRKEEKVIQERKKERNSKTMFKLTMVLSAIAIISFVAAAFDYLR